MPELSPEGQSGCLIAELVEEVLLGQGIGLVEGNSRAETEGRPEVRLRSRGLTGRAAAGKANPGMRPRRRDRGCRSW